MKPIDKVLDAIGRERITNDKNGKWQVKCPAHDDKTASLSISETDNGKVLLKCHAGCETDDILSIAGLKWEQLFPEKYEGPTDVATYDYTDENGKFLFQVVRRHPKEFPQRHKDPNGKWVWGLKGIRRVLYRLPKVLRAKETGETIFLVEGEKDVHTVERLGFVATTNPMGAGKWKDTYTDTLTGANVVMIPDNDTAGKTHINSVYDQLKGRAQSVRILHVPTKDKGDITDWVNAGGDREKLLELLQQPESPPIDPVLDAIDHLKEYHIKGNEDDFNNVLRQMTLDIRSGEAPIIKPRTQEQFFIDAQTAGEGLRAGYTDIDKYLRLRAGGTHIIAGRPGIGKTTIMLNFALNQARELYRDKTFVFLSYEVNEYDLETKAIMNIAQDVGDDFNNFEYYQAYFKAQKQDREPINQAITEYWNLVNNGKFILRYATYDVDRLCDAILNLNDRYDIGAFYVDYIQKIKIDKAGRNLSRQVQLQEISNKILETSNAIDKPIVLGAQLNRAKDEEKRPTMSDLRESGDIEQDAATIITLWRGENNDRTRLNWAFEKNRFGKAGETGELIFDLPVAKINNPEKRNTVNF